MATTLLLRQQKGRKALIQERWELELITWTQGSGSGFLFAAFFVLKLFIISLCDFDL